LTTDLHTRVASLRFDFDACETEPVEACNLCGSTTHAEVARSDRYGFRSNLLICCECGLGFLSPRLSEAEYARFYATTYRPLVSAYHDRTIDAQTVQEEQEVYAAELATFLGARLGARPPKSIIDVGGSTGVVGRAIGESFGSDLTVLDPAEDELVVAAEAGAETILGFAENYDAGGRTWDLVLLCQTIDHLLDISRTLDAIRAMLAPDGHAFIDVLDVQFMIQRRGSAEGASKIDHPFYLTRETAIAYFSGAGLSVVGERLADDGHWGFVLAPATAAAVDRDQLKAHADQLLRSAWLRRATPSIA